MTIKAAPSIDSNASTTLRQLLAAFVVIGLGAAGTGCSKTESQTQSQTSTSRTNSGSAPGPSTSPSPSPSPSPDPLVLNVQDQTLKPHFSTLIEATGGIPPYEFSVVNGGGDIHQGFFTGYRFTAGPQLMTATLSVRDATNTIATNTVTIVSPVKITGEPLEIATDGRSKIVALDGNPTNYVIESGGGQLIPPDSYLNGAFYYQAPANETTAKITATDAYGYRGSIEIAVKTFSPVVIAPTELRIYPGNTIKFAASGGSGVYTYTLIQLSPRGTLEQSTFKAAPNEVLHSAKIVVNDTKGLSATANILIEPQTFSTQFAEFSTDENVLLTFNMPNRTDLKPTFVVGGAGPGAAQTSRVFGKNVIANAASKVDMAAKPASAAIELTNYSRLDPSPYTGILSVTGRSGISEFKFCVEPKGAEAKLLLASNPFTVERDTRAVTYGAYTDTASPGQNVNGMWLLKIDAGAGAGAAKIEFREGTHNRNVTDCTAYTTHSLQGTSLE